MNSGNFIDTGIAVYDACGGNIIGCDADSGSGSFSLLTLTGLSVGATYYVAVWEWNNDTFGPFNICAWTAASGPTNDECANAISLTVNLDLNCGSTSPGTVSGATQSPNNENCPDVFDDDVWYSFVAVNTTHQVTINAITGSTIDTYLRLYSYTILDWMRPCVTQLRVTQIVCREVNFYLKRMIIEYLNLR